MADTKGEKNNSSPPTIAEDDRQESGDGTSAYVPSSREITTESNVGGSSTPSVISVTHDATADDGRITSPVAAVNKDEEDINAIDTGVPAVGDSPPNMDEIPLNGMDRASLVSPLSIEGDSRNNNTFNPLALELHEEHEIIKTNISCIERWANFTHYLRRPILKAVVAMARFSAMHPKRVVFYTTIFSLTMAITGLLTNFSVETSESILWSPPNSRTSRQGRWVEHGSDFPDVEPSMIAIVHNQGETVLTVEGMERVFKAFHTVYDLPGVVDICKRETCSVKSPTGFWENHNYTLFQDDVGTDDGVRLRMSEFLFSDGGFVLRDGILGNSMPALEISKFQEFLLVNAVMRNFNSPDEEPVDDNSYSPVRKSDYSTLLSKASQRFPLESASSFLIDWGIPSSEDVVEEASVLEAQAIEVLLELNREWQAECKATGSTCWTISVSNLQSRQSELIRSILEDIPLLTFAFILMTAFCTYSLSKFHRVKSHSGLGIGAVVTICFAIMTGYGFLFILNYPLTTLTYLFPYGMLGLGLDATFILTGAFQYTDPSKNIVDRVEELVENVGLSISVSTFTTCTAYLLGSLTSMNGLKWFCLYACATVFVNFVYQLTFFVALMVLDDQRIKANRLDMLICLKSKLPPSEDAGDPKDYKKKEQEQIESLLSSRVMEWYARMLIQPVSKFIVVVTFLACFCLSTWYASGIETSLNFKELFPADSFVRDYFEDVGQYSRALELYYGGIYFRDVDVSDKAVQFQMKKYVQDMVELPYVSAQPFTFWLRDFDYFLYYNATAEAEPDFNTKLDIFLSLEPYKNLYSKDIIRDANGTVIASRCFIVYDQIEPANIDQEVDAFQLSNAVSMDQLVNQEDQYNPAFFTFSGIFYIWELWAILFGEILTTVILSLCALFIICLIFVSHPVAALILTPTVFAIYVEIIAVFRLAGLSINALTAIGLITCLGLVMDYATHICITYFEILDADNRDERVRRVITTMGKSILKGGFTTFLGVLLLSTNEALGFRVIFVTFVGITTLGVGHGLIFIPVMLSLVGPMENGNYNQHSASDSYSSNDSDNKTQDMNQEVSGGLNDASHGSIYCDSNQAPIPEVSSGLSSFSDTSTNLNAVKVF